MDWRRRRLGFRAALWLSALAAGCAARSAIHTYTGAGVDLRQFSRYAWGPPGQTATGDPRLDNNEIFQARLKAAIDRQMSARGFRQAGSDSPELLVHVHASVEQRIDLTNREPYASCPDCQVFIYEAGTLVIDLVDARNNQVVWRGWSEGNVEGVVDNQRWMNERIDEDVARILARLPRRSG